LVFRDYPLQFHDNAQIAAEAAQCAHAQGKFWEYHDILFENQKALASANLKDYAKRLNLDSKKFDECLDSGEFTDAVKQDFTDGAKVGVKGTPAFFINGRFISGAQPYAAFERIINEELGL